MRTAHLVYEAVAALKALVDLCLWVVQDVDNMVMQVLLMETGDHGGCIQHVCHPTLAETLKVTGCADGTCAQTGVLNNNLRSRLGQSKSEGSVQAEVLRIEGHRLPHQLSVSDSMPSRCKQTVQQAAVWRDQNQGMQGCI